MQPIPSTDDDEHNGGEQNQGLHQASDEKLALWHGVALLTADCLGVGVLALPHDIYELGWVFGFSFLIVNFPINFFAGNYLSKIALDIEDTCSHHHTDDDTEEEATGSVTPVAQDQGDTIHRQKSNSTEKYAGIAGEDENHESMVDEDIFDDEDIGSEMSEGVERENHKEHSGLSKTYDLIAISDQVFQNQNVTRLVIVLYYANLFLVLGDYILVMSRAVSAMFLDQICIPAAGAIASILMFAISQLKTMANLGRRVSIASLVAMLIVLIQCLFHHRTSATSSFPTELDLGDDDQSIWKKFSALASIAFAIGSQKLFLNIRYELKHREEASKTLGWSLTTYGMAYLLVIVLAGPSKFLPPFLIQASKKE
jgi:hypothetical protein